MVDIVEIRLSNFVRLGFLISVVSSLVLVVAALGYRWDLWSVRFALLTLTKYGAYGALVGAALSLIGIGKSWPGGTSRGLILSIVGVIVGLGAFHFIFQQWKMVQTSPFIHDITTDTENPPKFVAIVPLRDSVDATHEYGGSGLALLQRYGGFNEPYKNILPVTTTSARDEAYDRALAVAQKTDWSIVGASREDGRIEAFDTSFWYGFIDDIVIRVIATPDGSRVDMRSTSRVGRSDVGVNAARIREYTSTLSGILAPK
ncbi:uncharacterized protein METZ01_LOCUS355034 [marine metagenome]|uniref:DUF1499 domain-containing protein n=1 Tax=marine metagenome TaxID=408172 RepID=A0A382RXI0_9ZZZZ